MCVYAHAFSIIPDPYCSNPYGGIPEFMYDLKKKKINNYNKRPLLFNWNRIAESIAFVYQSLYIYVTIIINSKTSVKNVHIYNKYYDLKNQ